MEIICHTNKASLEDSEVIVITASLMRERLNGDPELNMCLMMVLFELLYDQFSEFCSHTPAQRYLRLLAAILDNGVCITRRHCIILQYLASPASENPRKVN